jgi:hypothetical protein
MKRIEWNYRRMLRRDFLNRPGLRRHIARHARLAESTRPRASDASRARHAMYARLAREELAQRHEREAEARRVLQRIKGERTHEPLYDMLSGAIALECDAVIDTALGIWHACQHAHGPLPPLNAPPTRTRRTQYLPGDGLRQLADALENSGLFTVELTAEEKARLRARARRAHEEEARAD